MSGKFVPSVQTSNLVFVSGHIARRDGQPWVGRLGETMTTAEGQQAARAVAEDLLATLGDLSRIRRIVKVMVLVNSTSDFTEQHLVANGASELLIERVSEHARSAFGVAQLPYGVCVEIDLVAEVIG
jgi:enamine deaminase RidA (YjgF/YER057c/UK114 family)